jgi:hypothetical protein
MRDAGFLRGAKFARVAATPVSRITPQRAVCDTGTFIRNG